MDKYKRLAELMKGFQQSGQVFFSATIKSVEGNTCTISIGNLSISDVRLKPTTSDNDDVILLTPSVGSNVLVGSFSGNLNNLFIMQSDYIDEMYLKIDEMTFKMDKNGIVFNDGKNNGVMKINDVVNWMQKVHGDLTTLQTQLSAHPVAGNGAALGLVFNPSTPNPTNEMFEDKNVTH